MSITRYDLTIHLVTTSALHSGGVDEVVDRSPDPKTKQKRTAQRFARDGQGRPVLPGRSIKGAIRAACERAVAQAEGALTSDTLKTLWGGEDRASVLTVHPIVLCGSDGKELLAVEPDSDQYKNGNEYEGLRLRPGIAIDRYWGAVGDGALFMHEVLPSGARLTLKLSAHVDSRSGVEESQVNDLLNLIVALFNEERIRFGKRASIGWGRVILDGQVDEAVTLKRTQIDSPDGLLTWLKGGEAIANVGGTASSDALRSGVVAKRVGSSSVVTFEVEWSSPTGVLVADVERYENEHKAQEKAQQLGSDDKKPVPTRPYQDDLGPDGRMVIPGSSIRGALRSRATRIARTILFADGQMGGHPQADWSDMDVHKQLAGDVPLIHDLFGTSDRRGAIRVHDVLSKGYGRKRTVTHNRGDRWTGGAKDSALYSEEYYVGTPWDKIVVEVDPAFLYDPPQEKDGVRIPTPSAGYTRGRRRASLALLGLVMAELAAGTLPLGSRVTRGMGAVEVSKMTVSGPAELLGETPWVLESKNGPIAAGLLQYLRSMYGAEKVDWTDYLVEPDLTTDVQLSTSDRGSAVTVLDEERA